jgi:hypothetical protein
MANTYPIRYPGLRIHQSPDLSYAKRSMPEGATQTFPAMSPIVLTAGLVVQAADPATAIFGFAIEAGNNAAAAVTNRSTVVPAVGGLTFFANFLSAAGATNTLATADLGITRDFHTSDVLPPGSTAVWHAADTTAADSIRIIALESDVILPNLEGTQFPVVGDIDVRLECSILDVVSTYY